jgi:antitoxin component YwqK of YwqJK toxin-antitoxin module
MTLGDLVERDGLYYEKFTDVPYNGKATGEEQGSFKSGKREGAWVFYHENGQLWRKGNYKNGKGEGTWVSYYENGQLNRKGGYKNHRMEGAWVGYNKDGTVDKELTGTFKNGEKISD